MKNEPLLIHLNQVDNVAVVANDLGLPKGTVLTGGLTLRESIPQGHKIALTDLAPGDPVVRYGVIIAFALQSIPAGGWVNEKNTILPGAPEIDALPMSTNLVDLGPALSGATFQGYLNTNGSVGTRNLLAISTTVQCVSGIVDHAVSRIRTEILPNYPNVDGILGIEHVYGCGVAIEAKDSVIPIRTLHNIALNPNFGGEVMTVSLGCEKLQPDRLFPELGDVSMRLQDQTGFDAMVRGIMEKAEDHLERLNVRRRETCPAAALIVGMQCGGSDALSGVTANPALGVASDMLVRAGATVMFSENTEVRDGIAQLTSRAATPKIARELISELTWYDEYLARSDVDRAANTTPGNKAGGLSNIVEKAMGSIAKSGSAPISGVIPPGERATKTGLNYAATPASDFVCGTLQLAAGATVHLFTTGRGTPYSLEAMPTIKVATNNNLAQRWHDLIDVNAGPIANGEKTLEEVGQQLFDKILAVASGEKTWAEKHDTHNSIVLFNPAPIT